MFGARSFPVKTYSWWAIGTRVQLHVVKIIPFLVRIHVHHRCHQLCALPVGLGVTDDSMGCRSGTCTEQTSASCYQLLICTLFQEVVRILLDSGSVRAQLFLHTLVCVLESRAISIHHRQRQYSAHSTHSTPAVIMRRVPSLVS